MNDCLLQVAARKPALIHLAPAFHYDVAYCKTFHEYLPESLGIIRKGLRLLKRNKDFTFCIEQVILAREYWRRFPRERRRLKRFAREGRLYFAPGMFTMPDSNMPSGENFIRNALIGREWLRRNLGVKPDCCWMADIFGHNPQSPQLAKTCGYQSYMFERGKNGSWDTTFLWKGLDGTTIPAHWEVDTYYGIHLALAWLKTRPCAWIKKRLRRDVIGPLQSHSPCKTILLSPDGGDFLAPEQRYVAFVRNWNRKEKTVRFVFSTPARYFAALRQHAVRLKTLSDDLNPLYEGCWSSRIRLKQFNRRLEETAATLELLETLDGAGHGASERLWETLAWNAFHDIICGSLVKKAAREALALYKAAENQAEREIKSRLKQLIGKAVSGTSENNRRGLVLFNSLPFPRREIVAIPGKHAFILANIPATGWRFVPNRARIMRPAGDMSIGIARDGRVLENRCLRIEFARNGTIGSLWDKRTKRELALDDNGMNNPLLQSDNGDSWIVGTQPVNPVLLRPAPLHQPMPVSGTRIVREGRANNKATDADCCVWPEPRVIARHPLQGTVEFCYAQIGFTAQISLRANDPLIRFQSRFMPKGRRYRLRVAFPTTIRKGKIRHSVPFGHVARPEGEYAVQGWMDYADAEKGLLLLNRGLPGNNVTDGVMLLSLFRAVSLENSERTPWYEEGIEHVFEYALMPFDPQDPRYNPARLAALFQRPVIGIEMGLADAGPYVSGSLMEMLGDGAEVTCLKMAGDHLVIRLWESRGRRSPVTLVFADNIAACTRTDAGGNTLGREKCQGNTVNLALRPFEIATLKISTRIACRGLIR